MKTQTAVLTQYNGQGETRYPTEATHHFTIDSHCQICRRWTVSCGGRCRRENTPTEIERFFREIVIHVGTLLFLWRSSRLLLRRVIDSFYRFLTFTPQWQPLSINFNIKCHQQLFHFFSRPKPSDHQKMQTSHGKNCFWRLHIVL